MSTILFWPLYSIWVDTMVGSNSSLVHTLYPLVFLNSKWDLLKKIVMSLSLLFAGYNSQITGGENAGRLSCVYIIKSWNIKVDAVDSLLCSITVLLFWFC